MLFFLTCEKFERINSGEGGFESTTSDAQTYAICHVSKIHQVLVFYAGKEIEGLIFVVTSNETGYNDALRLASY